MTFELSQVARLQLTASQVEELSRFLHGFLTYHLGRVPRGRPRALAFGVTSEWRSVKG